MKSKFQEIAFSFSILPLVIFSIPFILEAQPTCTHDNPCPIECNQSLTEITDTEQYFNLSISQDTQVRVTIHDFDLDDYNLYIKWEPGVYPTSEDWCAPAWIGGEESCCWVDAAEGDYYYLKVWRNSSSAVGHSTYNITVECGTFCHDELCSHPYEHCAGDCHCVDFRPQMGGCNYYDYCVNGTAANDSSIPCCEDKVTHASFPCCILNGNPSDCSDPNAIRNESVIARYDFCAPISDYDITDVCIDASFANHTWLTC